MVAHAFNPYTQERRKRQEDLCELEGSLVYSVCRLARASQSYIVRPKEVALKRGRKKTRKNLTSRTPGFNYPGTEHGHKVGGLQG